MNDREVSITILVSDDPERFLVVRNVNDYTTHWMDGNGMWQIMPEDDEHLEQLFIDMKENPEILVRIDRTEEG